jgi:large subunit ribosomal protein L10
MAITKAKKEEILTELKDKLSRQKSIVLVGITGLKVKDLSALRKQLRASGSELKVVKKTLAEKALKDQKIDFDKKTFKTEVGFVFGFEDEILPAKTVYKFSKTNENLKILGGFLEGLYKDGKEVVVLAQLPGKQELLAKMVGSLSSPISGFVNVLQGNIKGLVLALNAISKNKQ